MRGSIYILEGFHLFSLFIRELTENVDKWIDIAYSRNMVNIKVIYVSGGRPDKERAVFEKETQNTSFTDRTITNIGIPDIHRILRKYAISHE